MLRSTLTDNRNRKGTAGREPTMTPPTAPTRKTRGSGHPLRLEVSASEEEDTDRGTDEARLATSSSSIEAKGNALKRVIVRVE